jgi:antitoxin (DNA-binding transcriptional repressor) of toxin-antitoxin stability system
VIVKVATGTDLRRNFRGIASWLNRGHTVQILKRGKPIARIVPEQGFLGCMAGTGNIPDDLDDPVPVTWDAMR